MGALDGPGRDALGAALKQWGVEAAALAWYGNVLDPDAERAQAAIAHLGRVVETAATLGVGVVCLAVGRDPSAGLGDSIAQFARRVKPLAEQAEASGVRLAVENDPMCGLLVEDMPGNAAFSPELWEKLFTHLRSDAVGLALDPSHLVWLGVDPIAAATDYAEKIFHFQAKDAEVFDARRQDCSCLRPGGGWWRYRLPGLGEIDWRRMLDRLQEVGYGGAVVVEHADPVWQGSAEKVRAGLTAKLGKVIGEPARLTGNVYGLATDEAGNLYVASGGVYANAPVFSIKCSHPLLKGECAIFGRG